MLNKNNFSSSMKIAVVCCLLAFSFVVLPNVGFAATVTDGISKVLCNVVTQLQGGIGKAIATIAIIVIGIGLFMGKLSWPLAVATAIGIGIIFGAANIVNWISAGTDTGTTTTCGS